jgi:hypothetical protein
MPTPAQTTPKKELLMDQGQISHQVEGTADIV